MPQARVPRNLSSLPLHQHQADAVRCIIKYLRGPQDNEGRAALVQMPTGAGKTGIIATLARLCPGIEKVLVLAPRVAVRDQLLREIDRQFFEKIGVAPPPRRVVLLTEEEVANAARTGRAIVLVATVQQLDSWRRQGKSAYKSLRETLDLVAMDEGHYEPAPSWSRSIRGLGRPVLLLTATPYRNDLKAFRIDPQGISTLRFDDAVGRGIIRGVNVLSRDVQATPNAFIDDVLDAFNRSIPKKSRNEARLIIRCDEAADIQRLCAALRTSGVETIGVHERFTDGNDATPWLSKTVPRPDATTAQVWVHQFKLLEGIDDPRFRMVAIYGSTGSVRSLVQQVGRVLRNPGGRTGERAFLLDHHNGRLDRMWQQFLDYDRTVTDEALATPLATRVADAVRTGFSGLEYFDREFRRPFSFADVTDPMMEFRLPLEVNVLRASPGTTVDRVARWIERQLAEGDCAYQAFDIGTGRLFYVYIRVGNSPYLADSYFLETRLGLVVANISGSLLAFIDTGGLLPINADEIGIEGAPSQTQLGRIIRDGTRSRISALSTRNSSVARGTIRTRSVSAPSLTDTSLFLDDFQHIVTSIIGYSDETGGASPVRRYVGFSRGRVSQPGQRVSLEEYLDWTDTIVGRTRASRSRATAIISRFSQELEHPPCGYNSSKHLDRLHRSVGTFRH